MSRALNAKLPRDVLIKGIEEVPLHFNARFDARSRSYRYIITRRTTPLWRRHFHHFGGRLDTKAMRRAVRDLVGERDFSSFCSSSDTSRTKVCRIMTAELYEAPPLIAFDITADHFLHTMVRSIAGTLIEIGAGKPWDMEEIVERRERSASGPTLPPNGLYLVRVRYEESG
jgi:tRNA pseudouridine38-40 synthase